MLELILELDIIKSVANFFAGYGWIGFISYLVFICWSSLGIGIYLKSRGVFENKIVLYLWIVVGIIFGLIAYGIAFILIGGGTMGKVFSAIVLGIVIGFICEITYGRIFLSIVWFSVFLVIFTILNMILNLSGILYWIMPIIALVIAVIIAGIIYVIIEFDIEERIAYSKYNRALKCLEKGDISRCVKYLHQSLYLLRDYDDNENPYINNDLANKIIALDYNLKPIQKANNYYSSGNHKKALELYEEIINKNPELKEIIWDKYVSTKSKIEKQFKKEIQKADNLFKNNKIEEALKEYEKLLNEYPMFENEIMPKINKCKEILKNPPIELFLEKAKKVIIRGINFIQ